MPPFSEPSTRRRASSPIDPSRSPEPAIEAAPLERPDLGPVVALVRWPAEAAVRSALGALGQPRLLILDAGAAPPAPLDDLEDWVHWPPVPEELAARAANLRARTVRDGSPPILDDDGLLRRGDRWVAISDVQVPMVQLLLDHLGRVVRYSALVEAYVAGGGTSRAASVRTILSRLDGRVRPVGLEIVTIRRRGVMLQIQDFRQAVTTIDNDGQRPTIACPPRFTPGSPS